MKRLFPVLMAFLLFFAFSTSHAQLHNAFKDLIHTQTARTLSPGALMFNADMNFFTKAGEFIGSNKPANFQATNYWLVAGNANIAYGFMNHFDASLGIRIYQDTHRSNEFNLPDDLFLTLRGGSFYFSRNHFSNAFMASFRIPTAEQHNYLFTEYASGAFEYGFMYSFSFFSDAYLPDRAFSTHFNIGYWNHNENGQTYSFENGKEFEATRNSQELRLALATVFPTSMFEYRLELSGMLYLQRPDNFIYSSEEWAYFTPSLRYKPTQGLAIDLGVDIRLSSGDRQWTSADIPDPSDRYEVPTSYPSWKMHMGVNLILNTKKGGMGRDINYQQEAAREKIELFEIILEEREKAKDVQKELEELKNIRKEAEKEIEDIKDILKE